MADSEPTACATEEMGDNCVTEIKGDKSPCVVDIEMGEVQQVSAAEGESSTETPGEVGAGDEDVYDYTKRDEYTSEIFKVELRNMPKKFGFHQFKNWLTSLGLNPVKLKSDNNFTFVTFRNDEEREMALWTLDGKLFKNRKIKAKKASPAADPYQRKRKMEENDSGESKKAKVEDNRTPEEKIKSAVTPLWNLPYEEQLEQKLNTMRSLLKALTIKMMKEGTDLRNWIKQNQTEDGSCIELSEIKPSPTTEGYRNKCEFTIGKDTNGTDNTIGFRYGLYKDGNVNVHEPSSVAFVPECMKKAVKAVQDFIRSTDYVSFDTFDHHGYWRQLTLRSTRLGHMMAMIDFHPQSLSEDKIEELKSKMKEYFESGDGKFAGITSLYFRFQTERLQWTPTNAPYQLLMGEKYITEELLGLKFRISPDAFFQVNTEGAEVLYSTVAEYCEASPTTTILDICCGTGTIGLSMAKKVEKVIGVELCESAVEDAKFNATENGVENITIYCSKAEDIVPRIMDSLCSKDVVAIVDPPRAGLHGNVIRAIRRTQHLTKLVYVACNAKLASNNFLDLCRPVSKRLKGRPFRPVKATLVDMFPHSGPSELIIVFERIPAETSS